MADDSTFVIMFGVLKRSPGSSACEWVDVQFAYIPRSSPRLSYLSRQAEVLVSFAGNLKFSYYKSRKGPLEIGIAQEMLRGVNNADLQRAWTPVRPETTFDAPDSDPDPELQMDIEYIVVVGARDQTEPQKAYNGTEEILDDSHEHFHRFNQKYSSFIKAAQATKITQRDVIDNNISTTNVTTTTAPEFVKEFKQKLKRRFNVGSSEADALRSSHTFQMAPETLEKTNKNCDSQGDTFTIDERTLVHFMALEAPGTMSFHSGITESDARSLFFHLLKCAIDRRFQFKSSLGGDLPVKMIVEIKSGSNTMFHKWSPRSDFSASYMDVPYLVVEVCSDKVNHSDLWCMFAYSASLVRLANFHRVNKTFILTAVYLEGSKANLYYFYEEENSKVVSHIRDEFDLSFEEGRIEFLRILYLISGMIVGVGKSELLNSVLDELEDLLKDTDGTFLGSTQSRKRKLSSERDANDGRGRGRRGEETADAELEVDGYDLISECIKTEKDLFEDIDRLPPNLHRGYRCGDPGKREFILKETFTGSNELNILTFLGTIEPPCKNIIGLVETVKTNIAWCIVLPKRLSIGKELRFSEDGGFLKGHFLQLSEGLVKGLSVLHQNNVAHLDIKPSNLVCAGDRTLQITDFDNAIRLEGAEDEIDDYCGTKGWIAPEIGEEHGPRRKYRPILADKWSCGRVLALFAKYHGSNDLGLTDFANRLMNEEPCERPALLEWTNRMEEEANHGSIVPQKRHFTHVDVDDNRSTSDGTQ